VVRAFARHLHTLDPSCEVPPADLLPGPAHRPTPYIYTDEEIAALVRRALGYRLHAEGRMLLEFADRLDAAGQPTVTGTEGIDSGRLSADPGLGINTRRAGAGIDDVLTQIVTNGFGVPARARQQMLQAVRGRCTAMLGDGPAILAVQTRDHPGHQFTGMAQGLVTTKARRDAIQDRRELRLPPDRV
jgi:hypothetical protein